MADQFSSPSNSGAASSSSSSSLTRRGEYELFISFYGDDVRAGFLSYLYSALRNKQINAFIDNELERAKDVGSSLFQIIEQSDLSIVIFSEHYPESEWCMEELEKIHECMSQRGHRALPVFYKVKTEVVQNLQGNYATELPKRIAALKETSLFSGCVSSNYQTEQELVNDIVNKADKILSEMFPNTSRNERLFGNDSCIKDVEALLHFDSEKDVRVVGIWGMGGIGKTTVASEVFRRNKHKFGGHCCIILSVREKASSEGGLTSLSKEIIRELLQDKYLNVQSSNSNDDRTKIKLQRVKVLLVLDDVLNCDQLKSLLEQCNLYSSDSFCQGSRIILTSRDKQVLEHLTFHTAAGTHEVKLLEDPDDLKLFSFYAFGKCTPSEGYEKLSKRAVGYAGGLPLALVVLGSEFKNQDTSYWETRLESLRDTSPLGIHKILRASIEDWMEKKEKIIFLDIACFLKGKIIDYVENMQKAFDVHASGRILQLIRKSLLKVEKNGVITMHDLVEQMGREMVMEERETNGHQSRLWKFDDIKDALTNTSKQKLTKNVEAIYLKHWKGDKIDIINPEAFMKMWKLRLLVFNFDSAYHSVNFPTNLKFPNSIKYLEWDFFPESNWLSNNDWENLVELHLNRSELKEIIWSKPLPHLKRISLHRSADLLKISDWGKTPNLEVVNLAYCTSLVEVGPSVNTLRRLTKFNFKGCTSPSHVQELPNGIKELELGWSIITQLPSTVGGLTQLRTLSLCYCEKLEILPSSISCLISLETIDLFACKSLTGIESTSLENLKNLTWLDASQCESLSSLPKLPSSIERLELSESGLKQLPSTIGDLTLLTYLSLKSWENLESLPISICHLTSLETLNLSHCTNLRELPEDFGNMESLKELDASYCSGLGELPKSIQNLNKLVMLNLTSCTKLCSLPALPSNLEDFRAGNCVTSIVEKVHDQPTQIRTVYADGSQVPKWMKYHNDSGSSISLDLEDIGHSIKFIFCVVILPNYRHKLSTANPMAILTYQNSKSYKSLAYPVKGLLINYAPWEEHRPYFVLWNCNVDSKYLKYVSFQLMTFDTGQIVKCGLHPIIQNENDTQTDNSSLSTEQSTLDINSHLEENLSAEAEQRS